MRHPALFLKQIAEQFLAARQACGIDLLQLSLDTALPELVLSKLERGEITPSFEQIETLASALGVDSKAWQALLEDSLEAARESLESTRISMVEAAAQAPSIAGDLSGKVLHGYRFLERIGEGGFGSVYRALQLNLKRDVAIKVVKPELANDADFVRRFEIEAELVARLEHPHIVPMYDYWREPGAAYMVMRLLKGGSLSQHLKVQASRQDSTDQLGPRISLLPLLRQVAQGLQAAHRAGVIHRDLKPANILLDEQGNACLADFGVAKQLNQDSDRGQLGEIVGSLAYSAPEQLQGLPVSPATDVYALATLSFELLAGRRPFLAADATSQISKHLHEPPPQLSDLIEVPIAVDAILLKGMAKDPERRPQDAAGFVAELESAFRGIEPGWKSGSLLEIGDSATTTVSQHSFDERDNPYLGLAAFDEGDARNFFGRETLIKILLDQLALDRLSLKRNPLGRALFVVGASGSGKSSVIRAGVIPALRAGALTGSRHWLVSTMLPGNDPFENLAAALRKISVQGIELNELLRSDSFGLARAVDRCLPADAECELVLVIDQFEELFTQVHDEAMRRAFVTALTTALLDPYSRLRLICTMRADFLDRPLSYPDLAELVRARTSLVPALTLDELERAITGPARRMGLIFESGLVSQILDEVRDQTGALPLLQYALSELFRRRVGRELKIVAFQAMGGVRGALAGRAEAAWQGLSEQARRSAQQIFLRLTTLGEGREDTRRRVLRSELDSLALEGGEETREQALAAFAAERLLSFDRDDVQFESTVEVAHEALLRSWTRLKDWLNFARTDLRLQRKLAESANLWKQNQNDPSFLISGNHLDQFRPLLDHTLVTLAPLELDYLRQAIAHADAAESAERERGARELKQAQALAEQERRTAELAQEAALVARRTNRQLRFLVAGLGVILAFAFWQTSRLSARTEALAEQTDRANAEAKSASALSDFWQTLFATADPNRSKGKDLSVRDVLDVGVEKIRGQTDVAPLARARLLLTIARTYRQLQAFDGAKAALDGAEIGLGADAAEAELQIELAQERLRVMFELRAFDEALAAIDRLQQLEEKLATPVLLRATTLNIKAGVLNGLFRYAEAAEILESVLSMRRDHGAPASEIATTLNNLAFAHIRAGDIQLAQPPLREALELKRTQLGEKHVETALMLLNLGKLERDLGEFKSADKHLASARSVLRELYSDQGAQHPALPLIELDLAISQRMQGQAETAFKMLQNACEPPSHCDAAWQRERAIVAIELGRLNVAEHAIASCLELSGGKNDRCEWRQAQIAIKRGKRTAIDDLRGVIARLDSKRPTNLDRASALLVLAETGDADATAAREEAISILRENRDYWIARTQLLELGRSAEP
jgi:serine/threonine protein kinase/tetratricopeptide (TPR) repeat protein